MALVSSKKVPSFGNPKAPITIIGNCPNEDEDYLGMPLLGAENEYLKHLLNHADLNLDDCYVTKLLNYYPLDGKFEHAAKSWQLEESQKELITHLTENNPKVIVCLGSKPLEFLTGISAISDWRGSVLTYNKSFLVPTYEPGKALVFGEQGPQIVFDFIKVSRVVADGFQLPVHNFHHTPVTLDPFLPNLAANHVSVDIETIKGTLHILSIAFAWSPEDAFTLRNYGNIGEVDEAFRRKCAQAFEACKEIEFHNGLFDVEVLEVNSIPVPREKYTWDTMYAQRVLEPELPIGLDFCASIYTNEAYYKADGKQTGKTIPLTLLPYNATDVIVTWQTREAQQILFEQDPELFWSYRQDMEDVEVALTFQRNGMLIDQTRLEVLKKYMHQRLLDDAKTMFILSGKTFNHASSKQVQDLLYKDLKLPIKKKRGGGVTSDEDALVSLLQYCRREYETKKTEKAQTKWLQTMGIIKTLLAVRGHEKMISSYINFSFSDDGRIRSSWAIAGTETGRWSCRNYVDGTGFNAQTPPREEFEIDEKAYPVLVET